VLDRSSDVAYPSRPLQVVLKALYLLYRSTRKSSIIPFFAQNLLGYPLGIGKHCIHPLSDGYEAFIIIEDNYGNISSLSQRSDIWNEVFKEMVCTLQAPLNGD
jgi:hypothetical protein